eukprot:CAMPEP_0194119024 /NCGR_PEP_ID=MMETSP0150-20130528/37713_1 /TAXON_ID=122233 /ORGANISM="Chaetoceros debilis, Strain MM31A-1" /LENGTH=404 /DNA_ID=CAMNT_0038810581 /DNA_START=58 /DNA_END=1268 /DNA_ORIENTATION=+
MNQVEDLDDILDACLDELDEDDDDSSCSPHDGGAQANNDGLTSQSQSQSLSMSIGDKNSKEIKSSARAVGGDRNSSRPVFGPPLPPAMRNGGMDSNKGKSLSSMSAESEEEKALKEMMLQMEQLFPSEDFGKEGNTHVNISKDSSWTSQDTTNDNDNGQGNGNGDGDGKSNPTNGANKSSSGTSAKSKSGQDLNVDDTVKNLLREISKQSGDDENGNGNFDGMGGDDFDFEAMMKDGNFEAMMKDGTLDALGKEMMKGMGGNFDPTMKGSSAGSGPGPSNTGNSMNDQDQEVMGQVVNGMMKQLLSKEFMYEPMRDICKRFPSWLSEHKESLSKDDYERYGKQYQYFQRIVYLYENDPDNSERLTELMNDLQEYGQPPPDLVSELAPDLEFDDDGMPKLDGMGG